MTNKLNLLPLLFILLSSNSFACDTNEEALNTMLKLNVVSAEYQLKAASDEPDAETWNLRRVEFIVAMVPYAKMIAEKQYHDACVGYRQVAEDFEVDLDKVTSMTVADYDRYDKKYPEKHACSTLSMVTRIGNLSAPYIQQEQGSPISKRINFGYAKYSHLYATDISSVCGFLNEIEESLKGMPSVPDNSGASSRRSQ
jgi:hypothetical protein